MGSRCAGNGVCFELYSKLQAGHRWRGGPAYYLYEPDHVSRLVSANHSAGTTCAVHCKLTVGDCSRVTNRIIFWNKIQLKIIIGCSHYLFGYFATLKELDSGSFVSGRGYMLIIGSDVSHKSRPCSCLKHS